MFSRDNIFTLAFNATPAGALTIRFFDDSPAEDSAQPASKDENAPKNLLAVPNAIIEFWTKGTHVTAAGLIASATIIAFISSVAYSFGFFNSLNSEGLWLLTPGDHITQSVPALLGFSFVSAAVVLAIFGYSLAFSFFFTIVYAIVFYGVVINLWRLYLVVIKRFNSTLHERSRDALKNFSWRTSVRELSRVLSFVFFIIFLAFTFYVSLLLFFSQAPYDAQIAAVLAFISLFSLLYVFLLLLALLFFRGTLSKRVEGGMVVLTPLVIAASYLIIMPVFGELDFYSKARQIDLVMPEKCVLESGSGTQITDKCFLRSLERGILFYDARSKRVVYDLFGKDIDVVFEIDVNYPEKWIEIESWEEAFADIPPLLWIYNSSQQMKRELKNDTDP